MGVFNFFIRLIDNLIRQMHQDSLELKGTLDSSVLSEKFIIESKNDISKIKKCNPQPRPIKHQNRNIENFKFNLNRSSNELHGNNLGERNTIIINKTAKDIKFHNFISERIRDYNLGLDTGIFEGEVFNTEQPTTNEIVRIIMRKLPLENLIALYERIEILEEIFDEAKKSEKLKKVINLKLLLEEDCFKFTFTWNNEDENIESVHCEYCEKYNGEPNKSYYNSMNIAYKARLKSEDIFTSQNMFCYIVKHSNVIDSHPNTSIDSIEYNEQLRNTNLDTPEFDQFLTDYKAKFKFNAGVFKGIRFKNIVPTNDEIKKTLLINISPKNIELLCNRIEEIKYMLDNVKCQDWSRCSRIELGKKSFIIEF